MPGFMVDSALAANGFVSSDLTLWRDVVDWAGAAPVAWGRYLGSGGGAATPLTAQEVSFLHANRCAILPIYNDSPLNGGQAGTYALGQQDADAAIGRAQALGVPAGVYLCCDIEYGAPLTADYVRGWCDTMRPSIYGGSGILYGALSSPGFAQPLLAAMGDSNVQRLLLWAATPEPGSSTAASMPNWAPDAPSAQTQGMVRLWQYAEGDYGGWVDLDQIDTTLLATGLWQPAGGVADPTLPASVPSWADAAVQAALRAGVISDPVGDDDFYRMLVVLDRLGLFP